MPAHHLPALPRRLALGRMATWAAWMGTSSLVLPVRAQTDTTASTQTVTPLQIDAALADQWRAFSRLGYGANAPQVAALQTIADTKAWALQQLDAAALASQSPPPLEEELQEIAGPMTRIFEGVQRERQARAAIKAAPETSGKKAADSEAHQRLDFSAAQDPLYFSRTMVEKTAVWRLQSCCQPERENPLLARMTEFWFNHLNVYVGKGPVRPFVGHYLIHVARAHALGRFEDLLLASARHPAMLHYLDQAQSVAEGTRGPQGSTRGLNENYARELMELHTLGVDGGYSQTDVRELAKVLTGWTVGPNANDGFRFAARWHQDGSKKVLGHAYPQGLFRRGEAEGVDAIRMLAHHPSTARRLSLRLAQFFVADSPSPELVQRLGRTFLDSGGDIRAWMQTLLESTEFWDPGNRLFKTPMDYACSVLTATQGAQDRKNLLLTLGFLNNAGQPLHGWQTPDGYKTDAATWLVPEALTRRADFALQLGRQSSGLEFLHPYMGLATLQTIAAQRPALRSGLLLASPEFMYK